MQHLPRAGVEAPQRPRIGYLDGIRGWAAFIVLQHHVIIFVITPFLYPDLFHVDRFRELISQCLIGDAHSILSAAASLIGIKLMEVATDGHFSVLVFFVLSGFALSAPQLDPKRRNLPLASTSRYFRLMIPVLSVTLIAFFLLKASLFFNTEAALKVDGLKEWLGSFYQFKPSLQRALEFAAFQVFFNYDPNVTYNSSLWTMPIELIGSFLIFSLLALFKQDERIQWKVLLVLALFLWFAMPLLSCFVFGYTLAEINVRRIPKYVGNRNFEFVCRVCFIAVAVIQSFVSEADGLYSDQISSVLAFLLVLSVCGSGMLRRFFSNPLSRFLGRISFPLYLLQIVVICSWSSYLVVNFSVSGWSNVTISMTLWSTTIAICVLGSFLLLPVERFSISAAKALGKLCLIARRQDVDSSSDCVERGRTSQAR